MAERDRANLASGNKRLVFLAVTFRGRPEQRFDKKLERESKACENMKGVRGNPYASFLSPTIYQNRFFTCPQKTAPLERALNIAKSYHKVFKAGE